MKTELAAVESIRRGVKGKPLIKGVKKLPPLYGKKKKPSSAKKLEAKQAKTGGRSQNFHSEAQKKEDTYKKEIAAARKELGLDIEQPPVKLD